MLTSIKKVSPGLRHSEEDNRSFVFISIIRIHSHPHSNQTQQKKSFFFSKKILCVRKFSTFFSLNASVLHSVYRRFTKKYQKNKHFCDRDHTHTHTPHTHENLISRWACPSKNIFDQVLAQNFGKNLKKQGGAIENIKKSCFDQSEMTEELKNSKSFDYVV